MRVYTYTRTRSPGRGGSIDRALPIPTRRAVVIFKISGYSIIGDGNATPGENAMRFRELRNISRYWQT